MTRRDHRGVYGLALITATWIALLGQHGSVGWTLALIAGTALLGVALAAQMRPHDDRPRWYVTLAVIGCLLAVLGAALR